MSSAWEKKVDHIQGGTNKSSVLENKIKIKLKNGGTFSGSEATWSLC